MFKNIRYTMKHNRCFIETQKRLTGKNTIYGYLHDIDKAIMYLLLPKSIASKIHRCISKHHFKSIRKIDYMLMVIDWECSRFTKSDKQLNARETLHTYYKDKAEIIEPIMEKLGL